MHLHARGADGPVSLSWLDTKLCGAASVSDSPACILKCCLALRTVFLEL